VSGSLQPCRDRSAFTLIELLTVIAIIGILAGISLPVINGARDAAHRARTQTRFKQWAAAMELFREEYGYYPDISVAGKIDPELFFAALTGRDRAGQPPAFDCGNTKRLSFYLPGAAELSPNGREPVDAFGNPDIAVCCDRDLNGIITDVDWMGTPWPQVSGETEALAPRTEEVRARIIFYSAGRGRDPGDLILSWP